MKGLALYSRKPSFVRFAAVFVVADFPLLKVTC